MWWLLCVCAHETSHPSKHTHLKEKEKQTHITHDSATPCFTMSTLHSMADDIMVLIEHHYKKIAQFYRSF